MNYSDKLTDDAVKALEKELNNVYRKAYNEVTKTSADYLAKYEKRDEELREALKDEKAYKEKYCVGASAYMTPKEHYAEWRKAQIGRGKRWEAVRGDVANRITEANLQAESIINGKLNDVFINNHNYSAYEIEKRSGIAFNLADENTIRDLAKGKNHTEFKTVKVNPKRDYAWNTKRIQNALHSGIAQGKSIPHLTDDFMKVMGNNRNAAVRNARTAVTSAQNAGREASYYQAQELGIEIEQEWVATSDNRTRDSHEQLDGVRVAIGELFPNGCEYPGDPNGEPGEVYNCRCTLRAILPKYNGADRTANTAASYKTWLESKKKA